ncbi:MAG: hypothetical protein R3C14_19935 [Caldilineaceae bacterium]
MIRRKFIISVMVSFVVITLVVAFVMLLLPTTKIFKPISVTTVSVVNNQLLPIKQAIVATSTLSNQIIAVTSTLGVTDNSKEITVQPLLPPKFGDGSEFGLPVHNPKFSPFSNRYIFTTLINSMPTGLWLASISKGVEKQLISDQNVGFAWAYDDNHIIYSPMPQPSEDPFAPYPPIPQPIILVSLDSGEQNEIGKSTLGWDVVSAPTGDIAFVNGEQVEIVNPLSGNKRYVPSALTIGLPVIPIPTPIQDVIQTPEKIPDFLLTPNPEELTPLPPDAAPSTAPNCFYPDCQVRIRISPDGKKLAIHQIVPHHVTLVIVEIDTQKSIFVTDQISGWYSFDWSPDSTRLSYAIQPADTRVPELWIVNANGSEPHQLVSAKDRRGIYEYITWMTNNKDILYIYTPSGAESDQWAEYQMVDTISGNSSLLFRNGFNLQLFNNGHQLRFFRENHADQQVDFRNWTADLMN